LDEERFPGACEIRKFRFDFEVVHVPASFSQSAATVIFFGRKFTSVTSYRLPERAPNALDLSLIGKLGERTIRRLSLL
jgi:hypothetical protein